MSSQIILMTILSLKAGRFVRFAGGNSRHLVRRERTKRPFERFLFQSFSSLCILCGIHKKRLSPNVFFGNGAFIHRCIAMIGGYIYNSSERKNTARCQSNQLLPRGTPTKNATRPVSRVLSLKAAIYLGAALPQRSSHLSENAPSKRVSPVGVAPDRVCRAVRFPARW